MAQRDPALYSWRLKLARAEYHLEELERHLREYVERNPYRAERRLNSKRDRRRWYYVLVMPPPTPDPPLILGDAIHNLRTALDHIAVAISAKEYEKSAGFPIESQRIWSKVGRKYLLSKKNHVEARRAFRRRIKGMPSEAQAIIKWLQPYRRTPPERHSLFLINRLENADKHRKLIATFVGLSDVTVQVTVPGSGGDLRLPSRPPSYREDGALLVDAEIPEGHTPDSEVKVEISGTPKVTVDIGWKGAPLDIVKTLQVAIEQTQRLVRDLERFVRAS